MKKDIFKYLTIFLLIITMVLIIKNIKHYVYIENKDLNICQKCLIVNDSYYCQVYGGDK